MAEREVWMPVVGYEGFYEVSNLGRVRRDIASRSASGTYPGKILTPSVTHGYQHVQLSANGVSETLRVHKIVITAFCGEAPFEGAHACHNDGDRLNNRLRNLRWDTPVANQADIERHGRRRKGEAVFGAKLTEADVREIRVRLADGERNPPIAEDFGVSISTVHLIRHEKIWRHIQ